MIRSKKIVQRVEGTPWEERTDHIARWFCCDCGLAHDLEFTVKSKKVIEVSGKRNEIATSARRRYRYFKCRPSEKWTEETK